MPITLHNKVNGRQRSLPLVDYVALGPGDDYFVQFEDGDWQFSASAPDDLVEAVQEHSGSKVELLAFAPGGGWFVKWADGGCSWDGLAADLDSSIEAQLNKNGLEVEHLALGPGGEWFARYDDGSWRARRLAGGCARALDHLLSGGWTVWRVVFGHAGSWAILYD